MIICLFSSSFIVASKPAAAFTFFPIFLGLVIAGYAYVYYSFKRVKADPVTYPPGYMPPPSSPYNCAGIFVNGASTAMFACSMFALNNTVLTEYFDPVGGAIIFFCAFLPFTYLSFRTDWFATDELHIITVVPSSLIVNTLCQFACTKVLYNDQYSNPAGFFSGVAIIFISLIVYVNVEQYVYDRDSKLSKSGSRESENIVEFDGVDVIDAQEVEQLKENEDELKDKHEKTEIEQEPLVNEGN